jgi:hypothetical protein
VPEAEQFRLALVAFGNFEYDGGFASPASLSRVVTGAVDPEHLEALPDGGQRLRAALPPPDEFAGLDPPLPTVEAVVDLDGDGRPRSAMFDAVDGGSSIRVEVTWSDWDAVEAISAPPEDEIDRTPWIDEDAVRALDPSLVVAPDPAPPGYELSAVSVYDYDDDCVDLSLDYSSGDSTADGGEYLWVNVSTVECYGEPPFDDTAGPYPMSIGGGYAEVLVGDAVVTIDTDLSDEELRAIAASLAPVDPEVLIAAAEGTGGWFGAGQSDRSSVHIVSEVEVVSS